jgi:hypothetical protein
MVISRRLRHILRGFVVGLALVITVGSLIPALASKPDVTWSENPVKTGIIAGNPGDVKQVSFVSDKKLKNVVLEVSPELAKFVTVQPATISEVPKAQPQLLTLTFTAPTGVGTHSGTITVKEKVKCKESDCSDQSKAVSNPLQLSVITVPNTLGTGAREFLSPGKIAILGVTPNTYSPSQVTLRFDLTGASFKAETVKLRVNEVLTPTQNLQITPNSVIATLNLAEGVNLGFRNSGSFSPDNAARTKIIEAIGQDRLGTYRSSGSIPPLVRTVVEIVGTVAPKDFQDPVTAESTSTIHSA